MRKSTPLHTQVASHRSRLQTFATLLAMGVMSASCASVPGLSKQEIAPDSVNIVEAFPEIDPTTLTAKTVRDTIKIGDKLNVRVFGQDTLSGDYVVDRSGGVSFPLLGVIQVADLNTLELRETLTSQYAESYLQNPSVAVDLEARSLGKVIVDGAVANPGVFEMTEIITLSEAIALSGGLTADAKGKSIFIVRNVAEKRLVRSVNLGEVRRAAIADPELLPEDLIFVDESAGRVAFREFLKSVPLLNTAAILVTR